MDLDRALPAAVGYATDRMTEDWTKAVVRSIGEMREHLGDEHSLHTLARSALLSRFHFHRVFRRVTYSTPARFLTAWRMAEAKRQLALSPDSVTDICMRVGYSSLGTFTTQFTRMVGVAPGRFRRLVAAFDQQSFAEVLTGLGRQAGRPARPQVAVSLAGGPADGTPSAVGLFSSRIPQARPAACAVLDAPGTAVVGDLPDGEYHALAMSFHPSVTIAEALIADDLPGCLVAAGAAPVRIVDGAAVPPARIQLRLRQRLPTDPPLVLALPLLTAAELTAAELTTAELTAVGPGCHEDAGTSKSDS